MLIIIEQALERWRRCRRHHHHHIVAGRFDGPYTITEEGEIIVATFQIPTVGAPFTGKLIFTGSDGSTPNGPIGQLAASDATTTVGLSADGQSYNIQMNAPADNVTVTWHDPAGKVPDFTATFTTQPVITVTGAFGPPSPGTTA